jgi:6-pyruvoyltetrahydropterin/6-carboxytetrahydropterin synthase
MNCSIKNNSLKYHSNRVALTKEFTFDSAHNLLSYEGKCSELHGHTYRLIITLSGFAGYNGICIDFSKIKDIYENAVGSKLDHKYLNDILPQMNTTAENMIVWIWEQIEHVIGPMKEEVLGLRIEEIKLYETPTSCATMKREWKEDISYNEH